MRDRPIQLATHGQATSIWLRPSQVQGFEIEIEYESGFVNRTLVALLVGDGRTPLLYTKLVNTYPEGDEARIAANRLLMDTVEDLKHQLWPRAGEGPYRHLEDEPPG